MTTTNAEKEIESLRRELQSMTMQLRALERDISLKTATLDGMERVFALLSPSEKVNSPNNNSQPHRRMRLGAKKRVIYQLVARGPISLDDIDARVVGWGIDSRLVRDVVRVALTEGDMIGNLGTHIAITKQGEELIKKAKYPDDWNKYKTIFLISAPTVETVGTDKSISGPTTPLNTGEMPDKKDIFT